MSERRDDAGIMINQLYDIRDCLAEQNKIMRELCDVLCKVVDTLVNNSLSDPANCDHVYQRDDPWLSGITKENIFCPKCGKRIIFI